MKGAWLRIGLLCCGVLFLFGLLKWNGEIPGQQKRPIEESKATPEARTDRGRPVFVQGTDRSLTVAALLRALGFASQQSRDREGAAASNNGTGSRNLSVPRASHPLRTEDRPRSASLPVRGHEARSGWSASSYPAMAAFHDWTERYTAATEPQRRATIIPEGVELASARRPVLAELIRINPAAALGAAVPVSIRQQLPPEIEVLVETRLSGEGDFSVIDPDGDPGVKTDASLRRSVRLSGRLLQAFVYGRRQFQLTKYHVSLHGIVLGQEMAVEESPLRLLGTNERPDPARPSQEACPVCVLTGTNAPTGVETAGPLWVELSGRFYRLCSIEHLAILEENVIAAEDQPGPDAHYPDFSTGMAAPTDAAPASNWTQGTKQVLLIRVDFPDFPGEPSGYLPGDALTNLTQQAALDLITNTDNSFYQEVSYRRTALAGTATPVLRLPQAGSYYATNADNYTLHLDARTAAAAAGYAVTNYDRIIVAFSRLSSVRYPGSLLTYAGASEIGGKNVWLNGYFDHRVTTHELGHTYGLFHANFWNTASPDTIGPGASKEYGDSFDAMGGAGGDNRYHFNPWFKSLLGWIDDASITTVVSNGTYRVNRFDDPTAAGILALKVRRDDTHNYWIGLRQKFGDNASLSNGAYIIWGYNYARQSDLLDMTPGSDTHGGDNMDPGLQVGSTFQDSAAGISISVAARGGAAPHEYLDVVILLDAFPPSITSQPGSQIGFEGGAVAFNVDARTSSALSYQWQFNGTNLPGATNASLQFSNLQTNQAGNYSVVLTNLHGAATSAVATLTVTTPFGLALDTLWSRFTSGGNASWVVQTNVTHDGVDAAQSGLIGDSQQSWLQTVVTGPGVLSFWWKVSSQKTNDFLQFLGGGQQVGISGEANWTQKSLLIPAGPQTLQWRYSKGAHDSFGADQAWLDTVSYISQPLIVAQPNSQTAPAGANVTFNVNASSTGPMTYQWQWDASTLTGETNASLVLSNVQTASAGNYAVVVRSDYGPVTSASAGLAVTLPPSFLWTQQIGGANDPISSGLAVDSGGNVCVAGFFNGTVSLGATNLTSSSGFEDIYVAKYDTTGHLLWARQAGGTLIDEAAGIAVDGLGNVYITGFIMGAASFGTTNLTALNQDIFVAKYDPTGVLLWVRQAGSALADSGRSVAVDQAGNVFVAGYANGATFATSLDAVQVWGAFVAKYDASGNFLWVRQAANASGASLSVDNIGNVYLLGSFQNATSFGPTNLNASASGDVFLAKYSNGGDLIWVRQIGGADQQSPGSLAVDGKGNVFATGYFYAAATFGGTNLLSQGDADIFLVKYDRAGELCWVRQAGGPSYDQGLAVAADGAGNVYLEGLIYSTANVGAVTLTGTTARIFLAQFDPSGDLLWVRQDPAFNFNAGSTIALDRAANVYLAANFTGTAGFGAVSLTSSGQIDLFVGKLSTTAPPLMIARSGGTQIISWPVLADGFSAEMTTNLLSGSWSALTAGPVVVGQNNTVALPVSGKQRFYRLRKP